VNTEDADQNTSPEDIACENTEDAEESTSPADMTEETPIAPSVNTEDADQNTSPEDIACENTEDADQDTSPEDMTEETPIAACENTGDADQNTSPEDMTEETPIAACENTEMERPCKIRKICGGVMPPGTYYIGDPSYVLGTPWTRAEVKDLRMNGTLDVLDRAHLLPDGDVPGWTEAYAERVKENEEDAQVKAIEKDEQDQGKFTLSNGREIVVFDTAYGPGLYTDCKGRRYLVQSRSICLTLAEGLDNMQQGNVIEYTEPFECVALVDSRPFSGKRPFSGGRVTIMHFGDEAGIETEFHHRSSVVKGQ
jgi:hypothetical protein